MRIVRVANGTDLVWLLLLRLLLYPCSVSNGKKKPLTVLVAVALSNGIVAIGRLLGILHLKAVIQPDAID